MAERVNVEVVVPGVDTGYVASGLYELSKALGARAPENQAHGLLGGEWGYGQDFANDVFEMFPFWWGDCECGHEEAEMAWERENLHADDCYQTELERRGYTAASVLAAEWGLSELGCAVHCTCGKRERWQAWADAHDHDDRCPVTRPNFKHYASGVEVRWYKYIGRSMEISDDLTASAWSTVLADCMDSLGRDPR